MGAIMNREVIIRLARMVESVTGKEVPHVERLGDFVRSRFPGWEARRISVDDAREIAHEAERAGVLQEVHPPEHA